MGGSAYKERVNRCRKFCAVSLALPRGSTSTAEPVLMTLARKLAAKTAEEEWVEVHPPSWTQAWVQEQWDLLVRGETETVKAQLDSSRFLVAFQHYLQGGFGHAAFKASLPEDVSVMLAMNEALVVEEVDRQIHVVTMFETHWRLRDHVFSELHKAMSSSDTHKLRFWMDWQDFLVSCTDTSGNTSFFLQNSESPGGLNFRISS